MKKVIAISLLLTLIILLVSCSENEEDNPHGEVISCYDYLERFEDFDSFAKYASNPETQTEYSKIDPKAPVDLGSIIPNEEIFVINSFHNRYMVYYKKMTVAVLQPALSCGWNTRKTPQFGKTKELYSAKIK